MESSKHVKLFKGVKFYTRHKVIQTLLFSYFDVTLTVNVASSSRMNGGPSIFTENVGKTKREKIRRTQYPRQLQTTITRIVLHP